MKLKIKQIVAREGLIVLAFLAIFIIGLFFSRSELMALPFWGYPLYLIIRFVIWAARTLFPNYFVPWKKIEELITKEGKFREALDLLERIETRQDVDKKAWESLKKTCIEGIFVKEIYGHVSILLNEHKFEEVIKLSDKGIKILLENKNYFEIDEGFIDNFFKAIENQFKDIHNVPQKELVDFKNEYIKKLESLEATEDQKGNTKMVLDLLMAKVVSKAQLKG